MHSFSISSAFRLQQLRFAAVRFVFLIPALALVLAVVLVTQHLAPSAFAADSLLPGAPAAADKAVGLDVDVARPHMKAKLTAWQPLAAAAPAGSATAGPAPGTVDVVLTLSPEAHWHTYWLNPGDAGLPPSISWTLPDGVTAGPLQFPTPHRFTAAGAINYGYEAAASFLTTLQFDTAKVKPGAPLKIRAEVNWLVCKDICLPGSAEFAFEINAPGSETIPSPAPATSQQQLKELADLRDIIPAPLPGWKATVEAVGADMLRLTFGPEKPGAAAPPELGEIYFYAQTDLAVVPSEPQQLRQEKDGWVLTLKRPASAPSLSTITGVIKADKPFAEGWNPARAWQLPEITVKSAAAAPGAPLPATASTPPASTSVSAEPAAATAKKAAPPFSISDLILYTIGAFAAGMILNVMPCVLPVLSLKVFSFINHGAQGAQHAWRHGLAYSVGVLVSFWALGLAMVMLRAAYPGILWGFLMQEPIFVFAMAVIFLVMGVSMFGVFEIGTSVSAAAAQAAPREGLWGSFGSGALATAAATPCTAPVLTAPILYAITQPVYITMAIFTALGVGLALPYLVLATFPPLLKYVPRPGPWMESFKQFLGFLMLGSALVMVFFLSTVAPAGALLPVLICLLLIAMACWVYGRWTSPEKSDGVRGGALAIAGVMMLSSLGTGLWFVYDSRAEEPVKTVAQAPNSPAHEAWLPYSPTAVQELIAAGKPVFIDFTADWCINCKYYERTVLETDAIKDAFARRGITTFKADFTRRNSVIAKALERYEAIGVPVYVLYGPDPAREPVVWRDGISIADLSNALAKLPDGVSLK